MFSMIRSVSTRFVSRTASTTSVSFAGRAFSRQTEHAEERRAGEAQRPLHLGRHGAAAQVAEGIAGELGVHDGDGGAEARRGGL